MGRSVGRLVIQSASQLGNQSVYWPDVKTEKLLELLFFVCVTAQKIVLICNICMNLYVFYFFFLHFCKIIVCGSLN